MIFGIASRRFLPPSFDFSCSSFVSTLLSSSATHQKVNVVNRTSLCCFSSVSNASKPAGEAQGNVQEIVEFLTLNNISDNPGAKRKGRRIGRGIGCSKGKTSGRGHKGQKARAGGGVHPTFEGGQTKFYKRIPKRGFTNKKFKTDMLPLNVGKLQDFIDMGRINLPGSDDKPLDLKDLVDAGLTKCSAINDGVKLLSDGRERLRSPIRIHVSRASQGAIEAIESVGGEITTVHYNKLALRALLKPDKFSIIPRFARPPPKLMPYYTSYKNRGYLSQEMQLKKLKLDIENITISDDALEEKNVSNDNSRDDNDTQ